MHTLKTSFFFLCFLASLPTWGQTITVRGAESGQAIPDVFIINSTASQSVLTNALGQADLSGFASEATLRFQHPAYQQQILSLAQVLKQGKLVYLQESIVRMEEVMVSANKWEQDRNEIPNQITAVTPQEIAYNNPQTSADLLAQTGEVFVQKSQMGGGSPMIRGFAANSVLIVVDGVRMNNAIYRSGNLQNVINLDANFLESAEVIAGPGSVIYGSDALGGVMDFHTLEPTYTDELRATAGGMARFSTVNQERTSAVQASVTGSRAALTVGGSVSFFDDLRAGRNGLNENGGYGQRPWYVERINGMDSVVPNPDPAVQVGSGFNAYNAFAKGKLRIRDGLELGLTSLYSTTSNIPRYDRLIEVRNGEPRSAQWYYGPQSWWFNALKLHHYSPTALYDEAKITLGFQDYRESRNDRSFGSAWLRHRTEDVLVGSINADFDKVISPLHQIFYGLEVVHNDVRSSAYRENIVSGATEATATRYPDEGSRYTTLAAYASHKWHPWTTGTVTTGLRYSHVLLNAQFSDTFYDFPYSEINLNTGALNGSLGLAQRLGEAWQLNALVSSGFRAPNIDDVGKVFDSEPGNVVVPNPNLAPEFVYNGELGLRYTLAQRLELQATGFYANYVNAMVRRPFTLNGQDSLVYDGTLSQIEAIVNTGRARIYGFSANGKVQFLQNWSLTGSLTWTDGVDLEGNVPLRHAAPLFGQGSLVYQQGRVRAEFYVPFNGERRFDELAPSEQDKPHLYAPGPIAVPAWYTLNVRAHYRITDHWSAQVALENILDVHYRPYSSGISAPGRNWLFSVRRRL